MPTRDSFISLDVKGWRELEQALYDLGNDRVIRATMKRAMLEAAEPMARDARAKLLSVTKRGDGSLEESIDVGVRLSKRQAQEKRGMRAFDKAKGTTVEVFVGAGKGGSQAHLIEFGTGVRRTKKGANRGQIAARPFMRPAWEANKHQVLRDFGVQLGREIEASARRIAKKRGREVIIETMRAVALDDAAILAAFSQRGYPIQLPDAPTYPAFVLTKITGPEEYDFAGPVGVERARVQCDVYSEDGYADLIAKKDLLKRRFSGFVGGPASSPTSCAIQTCLCITDSDFPVSDTERAGPRLRRRLLEFIVWNTEV